SGGDEAVCATVSAAPLRDFYGPAALAVRDLRIRAGGGVGAVAQPGVSHDAGAGGTAGGSGEGLAVAAGVGVAGVEAGVVFGGVDAAAGADGGRGVGDVEAEGESGVAAEASGRADDPRAGGRAGHEREPPARAFPGVGGGEPGATHARPAAGARAGVVAHESGAGFGGGGAVWVFLVVQFQPGVQGALRGVAAGVSQGNGIG